MKSSRNMPGRQNWDMEDWQKNDTKGLAEIILNEPEYYKELYRSKYNKELSDYDMQSLQRNFRNDKKLMAKYDL